MKVFRKRTAAAEKPREAKGLRARLARRNYAIGQKTMNRQAIAHNARNSLISSQINFDNARAILPADSKTLELIVGLEPEISKVWKRQERAQLNWHSQAPYLWKLGTAKFRAKAMIAEDRSIISKVQALRQRPEIAGNPDAVLVVENIGKMLNSHILRTERLVARRPGELLFGKKELLDVNDYIKKFLRSRPIIMDKEGFRIKVEFEPGSGIPRMPMDREDFEQMLENLLTDATTHPYLTIDRQTGKETAIVRVRTEMLPDGKIAIRFLSVGGQPISPEVMAKLGKEQYSITGKKTRGLGKKWVRDTALQYGGDLTPENIASKKKPEEFWPQLTVTLQPA